LIAGMPVTCKGVDLDQYERVVAVCTVGEQDIGERIVRAGFAFDWPRYSKRKYTGAQKEAERAGRGVWAGSYVVPWDYRACRWGGGRPSRCSDEAGVD
jgi:endonuclease YncB( thermonuclease family)